MRTAAFSGSSGVRGTDLGPARAFAPRLVAARVDAGRGAPRRVDGVGRLVLPPALRGAARGHRAGEPVRVRPAEPGALRRVSAPRRDDPGRALAAHGPRRVGEPRRVRERAALRVVREAAVRRADVRDDPRAPRGAGRANPRDVVLRGSPGERGDERARAAGRRELRRDDGAEPRDDRPRPRVRGDRGEHQGALAPDRRARARRARVARARLEDDRRRVARAAARLLHAAQEPRALPKPVLPGRFPDARVALSRARRAVFVVARVARARAAAGALLVLGARESACGR